MKNTERRHPRSVVGACLGLGLRGFEIAVAAGVKEGERGGGAFVTADDVVGDGDGEGFRAGDVRAAGPLDLEHGGEGVGLGRGGGGEGGVEVGGVEVEVGEVFCGGAGAGFGEGGGGGEEAACVGAFGFYAEADGGAGGKFLDDVVAEELQLYAVGIAPLEVEAAEGGLLAVEERAAVDVEEEDHRRGGGVKTTGCPGGRLLKVVPGAVAATGDAGGGGGVGALGKGEKFFCEFGRILTFRQASLTISKPWASSV